MTPAIRPGHSATCGIGLCGYQIGIKCLMCGSRTGTKCPILNHHRQGRPWSSLAPPSLTLSCARQRRLRGIERVTPGFVAVTHSWGAAMGCSCDASGLSSPPAAVRATGRPPHPPWLVCPGKRPEPDSTEKVILLIAANREEMSYSACQIGPSASSWSQ
jgi:hypothetical protein